MIYIFHNYKGSDLMSVYNDFERATDLNIIINDFMVKSGFKKRVINNYLNFINNCGFVRFSYSKGMQLYFIEVADSIEEAKLNVYEDADHYDASIPLDELVEIIKEDILKYYM